MIARSSDSIETAPDPQLVDVDGIARRLSEYWRRSLTVFVFVRHLGCIFCREQVKDLRAHASQIAAAGIQVVLVTPARAQRNAAFARDLDLPFPILADPERRAYAAFGFAEGTVGQLLSPRVAARSVEALLHGALPGKRIGNSRQLPGAVIVDQDGRVRYRKVARDAADHLTAADLLAEAARIAAEDERMHREDGAR